MKPSCQLLNQILIAFLALLLLSEATSSPGGKEIGYRRDRYRYSRSPLASTSGTTNGLTRGTKHIEKRDKNPPFPTIDDISTHIGDPGPGNFLFYTGSVMESARAYAAANGLKTLWDVDPDGWMSGEEGSPLAEANKVPLDDTNGWSLDDERQFFILGSQIFARMARGTVWLALPPDGLIPSSSILNDGMVILKESLAAGRIDKIMAVKLNLDQEDANGDHDVGNPTPLGAAEQYLPCPEGESNGGINRRIKRNQDVKAAS